MAAAKKIAIVNRGTNRIVVGPPPKSTRGRTDGGGRVLGAAMDQAIEVRPGAGKLSNVVEFDGDTAERLRKSKALEVVCRRARAEVA